MKPTTSGFTIVELLIVIVVIAILATISIVAYNGVQNRANDSAIQSDLKNFAKLIEVQKVDLGTYPSSLTAAMGFRFAKQSYGVDGQNRNLGYCYNSSTDSYVLMANSTSGQYYQLLNGVITARSSTYGYGICSVVGLSSTNPSTWGKYPSGGDYLWAAWTNQS